MDARKVILSTLSILLLIGSAVIALITLVFLMAGGANSTPAQIRLIKIFMFTLFALCLLGLGGTITLLILGRPGWSLIPSILPGAYCIALITWMFITEF